MNFDWLARKSYFTCSKLIMKRIIYALIFIASVGFIKLPGHQLPFSKSSKSVSSLNAASPAGVFDSDEVLHITLRGNVRSLLNDRGDNMGLHPIVLSYQPDSANTFSLQVNMKTRGNFRRLKSNCIYPPLSIQFSQSDTLASSIFHEQEKMKLVMPCIDDKYVIREWLVYKIYNLLTPKSFRARLVKVKLDEVNSSKDKQELYGILLEEEKQMAVRNKLEPIEIKIGPEGADYESFLEMAVFQYLIGNTDWSVQYLQNIKLIATDTLSVPYAVPYDFDHAGIVGAPYAKPAEELNMISVAERRYRGYCIKDMKEYERIIDRFVQLKPEIYKVYADCPLLDAKYKKQVLKYLDEFYQTIGNKKSWQKDFSYPCIKGGTGNVVIKGLKNQ